MELERGVRVVASMVRQDIEECAHKIKVLPRNVGDEEDGTYPLAHELGCCVDAVLAILDEGRHLSSTGALEDFLDLRYRLLQDIGGRHVNFRDTNHDRYIEGESKA